MTWKRSVSLIAWATLLAGCQTAPTKNYVTVAQWHTLELDFVGPETSEEASDNPFLNYRLDVTFEHDEISYEVRGFYAADGDAADTSANSGNIWKVRFSPDRLGDWRYRAALSTGQNIALAARADEDALIPIQNKKGDFRVVQTDKTAPDFNAMGRLIIEAGEYRYGADGRLWRKGGTNSPENLLGYADFDDTRRLEAKARDGEANATQTPLHRFAPHIADWRTGDPIWGAEQRGKGLIGAINYLASKGMNAVYFLTLNVGGDGNDVWPYADPKAPSRFDVSKLAQWNRVFAHMQANGIALHMVLQETENELWLDDGEMGPERQLYFNELIARFGHHPGLIWNLGEENGPAHWLPEGQTTAQRKSMAAYLKANDPYNHPVVLHTHSTAEDKTALLAPLLGFEAIDGLSFQVDDPIRVHEEVRQWRNHSSKAGRLWAITMDEIGHWSKGAAPDADDPDRDHLRRHALWGALMAGASGAEWYFGAHFPANDLTSEDWRLRDTLWGQTRAALDIFNHNLAETTLSTCPEEGVIGVLYCARTSDGRYLLYLKAGTKGPIEIPALAGRDISLLWLDPKTAVTSPDHHALHPPSTNQDWVALIEPAPH